MMAAGSQLDVTIEALKAERRSYVLATVVRTVAATAAKAGAKAIILDDGTIAEGWIGGGCARGAVLKASKAALADGQPRLVSIQPENLLSELGVEAGAEKHGVRFARNMCPSQGTMDIFVEPVLPLPELFVLGASPVAIALADISGKFGFKAVLCTPAGDRPSEMRPDETIDGFLLPGGPAGERYVVVATQGRGDEVALRAALGTTAAHIAFVGSRAKASALREKLAASGIDHAKLAAIKAPAGIDIGAITPEEIALSIMAELVQTRRRGLREEGH
ncbi:MAG: XdhC/CoxI family protein [Pseudomonadota bacterium]